MIQALQAQTQKLTFLLQTWRTGRLTDFSISVTSATPTSFSGQTVTYNVTAAAVGGFNSAITLGCNDFQEVMGTQGRVVSRSDYSCTASGPLTPGGTATVNMTIPADLPAELEQPISVRDQRDLDQRRNDAPGYGGVQ